MLRLGTSGGRGTDLHPFDKRRPKNPCRAADNRRHRHGDRQPTRKALPPHALDFLFQGGALLLATRISRHGSARGNRTMRSTLFGRRSVGIRLLHRRNGERHRSRLRRLRPFLILGGQFRQIDPNAGRLGQFRQPAFDRLRVHDALGQFRIGHLNEQRMEGSVFHDRWIRKVGHGLDLRPREECSQGRRSLRQTRVGRFPGQRLVQAKPQRIDVHARIAAVVGQDNLRRHVVKRARHLSRRRRAVDVARDAQIHDRRTFGVPLGIVEVRRLDVAVENAAGVENRKPVREARKRQQRVAERQGRAARPLDGVPERTSRHPRKEIHYEEGLAVAGVVDHEEVDEAHEARIVELGHDLCLAVETLRVGGLQQMLDRHELVGPLQTGLVHFSESALADDLENAVRHFAVSEGAIANRLESGVELGKACVTVLRERGERLFQDLLRMGQKSVCARTDPDRVRPVHVQTRPTGEKREIRLAFPAFDALVRRAASPRKTELVKSGAM